VFYLPVSLAVVIGFVVKLSKTWRVEDILSNSAVHEMDSCLGFHCHKFMSFPPYTYDMLLYWNSQWGLDLGTSSLC
jgi:hypothetical protein